MAKTKTSIDKDSRKDMPARGRGKRNIILAAMEKTALLNVPINATKDKIEEAWFEHLVKVALDSEDKDSGLCLRLLTERGWSALKPSSDCVQFEFDKDATPTRQACQVMDAVAGGIIPPDLGISFVSGIRSMVDIETNTEIKDRLEKLEAMINGE